MKSPFRSGVLIASTTCWPMAARLAGEFVFLGADVQVVCPNGSPLRHVTGVAQTFDYAPLSPVNSLAKAMWRCEAELIIPCDDRVIGHLHAVHARESGLRHAIERSIGDPAGYATVRTRADTMALAADLGIHGPNTRALRSREDVAAWTLTIDRPGVMKADGSWGGNGVEIVYDRLEALLAFQRMTRQRSGARLWDGLTSDRYLLHGWVGDRAGVVGQDFVTGRQINVMAACWKGEIIATAGVAVLETANDRGAATIIQPFDDLVMPAVARKIVGHLRMSGFCGFDFIRTDEKTFLIEMNPRATQLGHMPLVGGAHSLAAALLARSRNEPLALLPWHPEIKEPTIAVFPQAWMKAPSPARRAAHADIPWDDPKLLGFLVRRLGDNRRFVDRVTDKLFARRTTALLVEDFQLQSQSERLDTTRAA